MVKENPHYVTLISFTTDNSEINLSTVSPQAVPPQAPLQAHPQDTPRVDGTGRHSLRVLPPSRARVREPHADPCRSVGHGVPPLRGHSVVQCGHLQHHNGSLRVPSPLPTVSRGTRFPPSQVRLYRV